MPPTDREANPNPPELPVLRGVATPWQGRGIGPATRVGRVAGSGVVNDRRGRAGRLAAIARSRRGDRVVGGRPVRGAAPATLAAAAAHQREHHESGQRGQKKSVAKHGCLSSLVSQAVFASPRIGRRRAAFSAGNAARTRAKSQITFFLSQP